MRSLAIDSTWLAGGGKRNAPIVSLVITRGIGMGFVAVNLKQDPIACSSALRILHRLYMLIPEFNNMR